MALVRSRPQQHEYAACDDPDCPRFPCRIYKEGWRNGYTAGHAAGYGQGYAEGFADGADSANG